MHVGVTPGVRRMSSTSSGAIAVIPARMSSSRFPGKPLATLLGRPMIEHVFRRTAACALISDVVVATCDREIADAVRDFGGTALLTSSKHERATDRVAEAVAVHTTADIIVMVQGDEPTIQPSMIARAVRALLLEPVVGCVNLVAPLRTRAELVDANVIKVARALNWDALLFSREPIPSARGREFVPGCWLKQVCVMAFRRRTLLQFAALTPSPLEILESIDMLRLLEHGIPVRLEPTEIQTQAVDVPADLERAESLLTCDPFTETYLAR
jgi:3-deoxy-manno-octulosonate cytidylyltransferase (CMP-KDO synthetase)